MANEMSPEAQALAKTLLVHQKKVGKTILVGYKKLCEESGVPFNRQTVGEYLCEIAEWCKGRGLPPINALAVNEKDKRPGPGYDKAPACDEPWELSVGKCLTATYPAKFQS